MFKHKNTMCCSTCFEEMHPILHDDDGKPIVYICHNCGKLTDLTDEI